MLRILILANLYYLSAFAGGNSHTLDSSGGIIKELHRVNGCSSENYNAAAVLFADTSSKKDSIQPGDNKTPQKPPPKLYHCDYGYIYENNFSGPWGPSGPEMKFSLSHDQVVCLQIFDISGCSIFDANTWLTTGWHNFIFSGHDDKGKYLPPGFYWYRAACEDTTIVLKIRQ